MSAEGGDYVAELCAKWGLPRTKSHDVWMARLHGAVREALGKAAQVAEAGCGDADCYCAERCVEAIAKLDSSMPNCGPGCQNPAGSCW